MKQIFKDSNDYNEKTIIGFFSFAVMVLVMVADIVTGILGKDLTVNEFVYNSFVIITLGSFGVAGIEKFAKGSQKEIVKIIQSAAPPKKSPKPKPKKKPVSKPSGPSGKPSGPSGKPSGPSGKPSGPSGKPSGPSGK